MKFSIVPSTFDRETFYHGEASKRVELADWLIAYCQKITPGMYDWMECQAASQAASAATKVKREALRELKAEAMYYNDLATQYA